MKHPAKILLLLSLSFILVGCGKKDAAENAAAKAEIYVENDSTLDLCIYNTDTLNPLVTSVKHNAEVLSCLYDSLFTASSDFTAVPDLCTEYAISEDGRVLTARIRQNVQFHDGEPLTAEDVAASLRVIISSSGYYKSRLKSVQDVTVEHGRLHILFTEPITDSICLLLDFPVLPKGGFSDTKDILAPPSPGSGLYFVSEYRTNKELRLLRNTEHHSGKLPYFETVTVHMAENQETALSMLENGLVDVLTGSAVGTDSYTPPELLQAVSYPGCGFVFLGMRQTKDSARIARAVKRDAFLPPNTVSAASPVHPNAANTMFSPEVTEEEKETVTSRRLLYCENSPHRRQIALQIQKSLLQIGIDVRIESVSEKEFARRISRNQHDMFIGETELLPTFDNETNLPVPKEQLIGLYFKNEVLLHDGGMKSPQITTLNPYRSLYLWMPFV